MNNDYVQQQNGWCNVSEYFDNISTIWVSENCLINCSQSSIEIHFFKPNPTVPASKPLILVRQLFFNKTSKEWSPKKLFETLAYHGIDISNNIPDSKKAAKRKNFFTLVNQLAINNPIIYPAKPGLTLIDMNYDSPTDKRIKMYASNNFPYLYTDSFLGFDVNQLSNDHSYHEMILAQDLNSLPLFSVSIPSMFLILLRYLSLLMPLSTMNSDNYLNLSFPFIITASCSKPENLLSIIPQYLLVFKNYTNPTGYHSINTPFDQLRQIVYYRINSFICIDAVMNTEKIRSENINFLRDYFTSEKTDQLCCIISNTIHQQLSENEYIDIFLEDITVNPQFISNLDKYFIYCMMYKMSSPDAVTLTQIKAINDIYNDTFIKYGKVFNDPKVQNAVTSLMTVYRFLAYYLISINDADFENKMFEYIRKLFDKQFCIEESEIIVDSFGRKLQNMIESDKVTVLMHDKGNKKLPYRNTEYTVYLDNGSFIIPSETFENICKSINIPSHKLKKALCSKGYLHMNDTLYVTKITMYPPGAPPDRGNAYIICSEIIEKSVIDLIQRNASLSLSSFKHTTSPENGIKIGYDYNGKPVIWSYKKLATAHLMVTGKSGQGKTTFISKSINRLAKIGEKAVIFDFSQSYADNPKLRSMSVVYQKLPINPFIPRTDEEKESYINRVFRGLSQCFKLSQAASSKLKNLLNESYSENTGIDTQFFTENAPVALTEAADFISIIYRKSDDKTWNDIFGDKNAAIISIDDSIGAYEKITELLLQDYYSYKQSSDRSRVFIVVDEIQNLINNDTSAIITILSQGRDKGMGLIMSTQSFKTIPQKYRSMFLQSGLNIYFQPEITAVDMITKLIKSDSTAENVSNLLRKLDIGEFIAYGSIENSEGKIESDRIVFVSPKPAQTTKKPDSPQYNEHPSEQTHFTDLRINVKIPPLFSSETDV